MYLQQNIGIDRPCERCVPDGQQVFGEDDWQLLKDSLRLSCRELQIARAIFDDQKELAIALDLAISPHTVNTYLQRLYQKLSVNSRAQLIVRIVAEYLANRSLNVSFLRPSNLVSRSYPTD